MGFSRFDGAAMKKETSWCWKNRGTPYGWVTQHTTKNVLWDEPSEALTHRDSLLSSSRFLTANGTRYHSGTLPSFPWAAYGRIDGQTRTNTSKEVICFYLQTFVHILSKEFGQLWLMMQIFLSGKLRRVKQNSVCASLIKDRKKSLLVVPKQKRL